MIHREDEAVGSKLLTISATDLDTGLNGDIRYVIRSGDPNGDLWLDSHLGHLYVQRRLDYERRPRYELEVVAEDLGDPRRADTATVTVTVTDVNDNAPQVTTINYPVPVPDTASVITPVITINYSAFFLL